MDPRARFRDRKQCVIVQGVVNKEVWEALSGDFLTGFDRVIQRRTNPCVFGKGGTCCRICNMGPCQVIEGIEDMQGACGATAATVAARNFARMVAGGASAHSDHGRGVAETFYHTAQGKGPYKILDYKKVRLVAHCLGLDPNQDPEKLALQVGEKALSLFGQQEGEIDFLKRAPKKRQEIWKSLGIAPRGIDREVVELYHLSGLEPYHDYKALIMASLRCALADGWGGSMIATELQDALFGTPEPIRAVVNLGVLKEDMVNVTVHGHEPEVAEALAMAARDPELIARARRVGAQGINLAGVCCTGNEILMRHGIPIAGSFIQQEMVLSTGMVEAMIVDVQCIMQNIVTVAENFHTLIFTVSPKAEIEGAKHIPFHHGNALEAAKKILRAAIDRFPKRDKKKVFASKRQVDVVAGFSHETILYILGGRFRASYKPLNENIINGRIRGVAAIVGCDNFRVTDEVHIELAKELIANDVLVLVTGCAATGMGRAGLLSPEAAELAGDGLREVLEAVGCPPVLHMGSCVDNSRILAAATEMVAAGGLGEDVSDLPVAGCATQWMSEKAISIGQYFVGSGVLVVFGPNFPTTNSEEMTHFMFKEIESLVGGKWQKAETPSEFASIMIDHIDQKRKALEIDKPKPRVLFDMAMRRSLADSRPTTPFHDLRFFGSYKKLAEDKESRVSG